MSEKERERLTIMAGITQRELMLVQSPDLMAVCYRQSNRIWRRYQADENTGLMNPFRGQPPRSKPELKPSLRVLT